MAAQHNRIPSHEEFNLGSDVPAHHSQESLIEDDPSGVAVLGDGFYQGHIVITMFTHCIYDGKRVKFQKLIISTGFVARWAIGDATALNPGAKTRWYEETVVSAHSAPRACPVKHLELVRGANQVNRIKKYRLV
jgi:hypothetical protein